MVRLTICVGCEGGKALAARLKESMDDVEVVHAGCLQVCARSAGMAAQAEGRATYVFGALSAADADDIARFVAAYRVAPKGWIADARPLGRLRDCLVARVPAMP
ncbi:MAG: hypothetical protein CMH12_15515 [Maritimibacter sp.]|nr:hypothetical protein [Maritimibacter sp.]|tara:strand:+ start:325 stop:636 length:312 start_codon:yes stop_codon:yes gene_type:complete